MLLWFVCSDGQWHEDLIELGRLDGLFYNIVTNQMMQAQVANEMQWLRERYTSLKVTTMDDVVDYHNRFR